MLTQLGKKHNTDKCGHITNGKSYLDIYEQYFNNIKSNTLNILEIGIRDGCSLRMWKEYFHNSNIIGLDIDPRCSSMGEERIKVFIGSQNSEEITNEISNFTNGKLDIIIDDGSHINKLTIESYKLLYKMLNPGGLYIIEDLGNSYFEDIGEQIKYGGWPGMNYNKNIEFVNKREDMDIFFNNLIKNMDLSAQVGKSYHSDVGFIHFYPRIAIIQKI
jgi:hypothetical protein